jgi:membrane dipeptidase
VLRPATRRYADALMRTPVVDAHLDMAGNVLIGRDHDLTAEEVRRTDDPSRPKCMVTLRELERGGVAVACATLYVGTATFDGDGVGIYREDPCDSARRQLDVYLGWEADGKARIIRKQGDLKNHLDLWQEDGKLGVVVLIEGGDSITTPDTLADWWDAGVRIVGPAWSGTRYCGGTRRPGPLTDLGRELIVAMREMGMILDFSHMAEQSFWDAIELGPGRVIASHSNARAIVPGGRLIGGDRQLTDDMIRAIGERDGVIGLVLFNGFLTPDYEAALIGSVLTKVLLGPRPDAAPHNFVTLDHVRAHAEHMAALIGWDKIGIGSDFDGGLGVDETPLELRTAADVGRVAEVAPPEFRDAVAGGNWLRVLSESLPA